MKISIQKKTSYVYEAINKDELIDKVLEDFECKDCSWSIEICGEYCCQICDGKPFGSKKCREVVSDMIDNEV